MNDEYLFNYYNGIGGEMFLKAMFGRENS